MSGLKFVLIADDLFAWRRLTAILGVGFGGLGYSYVVPITGMNVAKRQKASFQEDDFTGLGFDTAGTQRTSATWIDAKIGYSAMHTYSVALRISGTDIDLAEVSDTLKLKPSQTRTMGQPRDSSNFVWPESMWEYEVRPSGSNELWDSLEDGLETLIATFASRVPQLRSYQRGSKVFLWCGHYSSSFGGGPMLSPRILNALGGFGVELMLETYVSDEPGTE